MLGCLDVGSHDGIVDRGATVTRRLRKPYHSLGRRQAWTEEEHKKFVEALSLYKRDWKKIEDHVGTKNVLQIRSHAQKYFGKIEKNGTGEFVPPARPKKRATHPYPRRHRPEQQEEQQHQTHPVMTPRAPSKTETAQAPNRVPPPSSFAISPILSPIPPSPTLNQVAWEASRQHTAMMHRREMDILRMQFCYPHLPPPPPSATSYLPQPYWPQMHPAYVPMTYPPPPAYHYPTATSASASTPTTRALYSSHGTTKPSVMRRAYRREKLRQHRRRAEELNRMEAMDGESDSGIDTPAESTVTKETSIDDEAHSRGCHQGSP